MKSIVFQEQRGWRRFFTLVADVLFRMLQLSFSSVSEQYFELLIYYAIFSRVCVAAMAERGSCV
ncbi:hypothetical protein D3C76_914430 [compost metagenome]